MRDLFFSLIDVKFLKQRGDMWAHGDFNKVQKKLWGSYTLLNPLKLEAIINHSLHVSSQKVENEYNPFILNTTVQNVSCQTCFLFYYFHKNRK